MNELKLKTIASNEQITGFHNRYINEKLNKM